MPENLSLNNLESEILELEKKIEEKRHLLESQNIEVEEKELVRESIGEMFKEAVGASFSSSSDAGVSPVSSDTQPVSYLDSVDEEAAKTLKGLVEELSQKGLKKTLKEAQNLDAYTLDAFHDLLVDQLYDELKARGIVK